MNALRYGILARWSAVTSSSSPTASRTSLCALSCALGSLARQNRLNSSVGVVVLSPSENSDRQMMAASFKLKKIVQNRPQNGYLLLPKFLLGQEVLQQVELSLLNRLILNSLFQSEDGIVNHLQCLQFTDFVRKRIKILKKS